MLLKWQIAISSLLPLPENEVWGGWYPSPRLSHSLHHTGSAALLLLLWQRGIVHLPDYLSEQLIHHGLALGRSLDEGAAPFLGQGPAV